MLKVPILHVNCLLSGLCAGTSSCSRRGFKLKVGVVQHSGAHNVTLLRALS